MAMATRCPTCATVFRVTAQQLQLHQGQVRCGRCMAVFDGFRELTTLPDEPQAGEPVIAPPATAGNAAAAGATVPAADTPAPAEDGFDIMAPPPAGEAAPGSTDAVGSAAAGSADQEFDIMGAPAPEVAPEPAAEPAPEIPEFGLEPIISTGEPPPEDAPAAAAPAAETPWRPIIPPDLAVDDEEPEAEPGQPRRPVWPWAVGSAILLVALALQAAYVYRSELAVAVPVLKPVLIDLCARAGCRVPLPQDPKMINIEASDLQAVDATQPGLIQLTATLRNHATFDVGFPALDLVLTNTREHTLARRIFLPSEYLGPTQSPASGIPAKAEVTVRLQLDTGDLGAAGFRLDLLPAPVH